MANERLPAFPVAALGALLDWWAATRSRGVIIGGVAVSLLSVPRFTKDIDATLLTDEDDLAGFLATGETFGFVPRNEDAVEFARRARIFLVQHAPTGMLADIALAGFAFEVDMILSAEKVDVEGLSIPLPRPEELVVMKATAHRGQDLADIDSVLDMHPGLDLGEVRRILADLEAVSDDPTPTVELERLLSHRRRVYPNG